MSTKSNADNIKDAAKAETDPKALSGASTTEPPKHEPPKGDGKAPYKEDFTAVYARLDVIENRLKNIEDRLGADKPEATNVNLEQRLNNLEARITNIAS